MSYTSSDSSSEGEAVEGMPMSMHDINIADLIFEDSSFARGAFGRMVKADYFGVTVCVKILKKQRKKELAKFIHREMAALKTLSHPNLVQFIGLTERGNEFCLVTEYISGGTLRKLLKDRSIAIPWPVRVQIAVDISSAMTYLHSRKIMHRDLKSKNLLVGDNWKVKICDFGFARSIHDKKKTAALTFCGTEEYMAPEVIFGMEYDERAEVYSYGLLLCEIMTRQKVEETVPRTSNTNYGLDHQEFTAHVPRDCPIELLQLAFLCTEFEPKNRPEFREITQLLREIKQNVNTAPVFGSLTNRTASPTTQQIPQIPSYAQVQAHAAQRTQTPAAPQVQIPAKPPSPPQTPLPPPPSPTAAQIPSAPIPAHSHLPPVQEAPEPPKETNKAPSDTPEKAAPVENQKQNGDTKAQQTPLRHPVPIPFRRSPSTPIMPDKHPGSTNKASARGASKEVPASAKLGSPAAAASKPIATKGPTTITPVVKNSARVDELQNNSRPTSHTFPTPQVTPPTKAESLPSSPPSSAPIRGKPASSRAQPVSSPPPPKSGIPVLPKVQPTNLNSPNGSPRMTAGAAKDRPNSPAKPTPPTRAGRPSLPGK